MLSIEILPVLKIHLKLKQDWNQEMFPGGNELLRKQGPSQLITQQWLACQESQCPSPKGLAKFHALSFLLLQHEEEPGISKKIKSDLKNYEPKE